MGVGMSVPARRQGRWMRLVQAYMTALMIIGVGNRDFVRLLEHLYSDIPKNEWYPAGPTLITRGRIGHAAQSDFAGFFHHLRCFGLQNRIGVITDQLVVIAHAVPTRKVPDRTGPRRWRRNVGPG